VTGSSHATSDDAFSAGLSSTVKWMTLGGRPVGAFDERSWLVGFAGSQAAFFAARDPQHERAEDM